MLDGASMDETPVVERSQMERGVAKVRRVATDPIVTQSGALLFRSPVALQDFRDWFYSPTGADGGAAWFPWRDPRTNTVRQVRLVADSLGPVTPLTGGYGMSTRTAALEFVDRL